MKRFIRAVSWEKTSLKILATGAAAALALQRAGPSFVDTIQLNLASNTTMSSQKLIRVYFTKLMNAHSAEAAVFSSHVTAAGRSCGGDARRGRNEVCLAGLPSAEVS
jgi:hypothetical protein